MVVGLVGIEHGPVGTGPWHRGGGGVCRVRTCRNRSVVPGRWRGLSSTDLREQVRGTGEVAGFVEHGPVGTGPWHRGGGGVCRARTCRNRSVAPGRWWGLSSTDLQEQVRGTGEVVRFVEHGPAGTGPWHRGRRSVHMFDDGVAEFGALEECGAVHESFEVVGDGLGGDGAVHALDDEVGGFVPAEVSEHHLA
ncbi:hypothetical protein Pan265_02460 [Mucisphaera calidilacus]|uniref:Uncharacterized protein n=1 Tax=Mucisphaera calidilacus TaxID=2527982 RepID=A0A518BTX7_9BACT|nr:hypothetical protein Pan265_02460 [Mucisphaera calidilacus]